MQNETTMLRIFFENIFLKGEIMVVEQEDTELNILQQTHKKYIYMWETLAENKSETGRKAVLQQGCKERYTWSLVIKEEMWSIQDCTPIRDKEGEDDITEISWKSSLRKFEPNIGHSSPRVQLQVLSAWFKTNGT